MRLQGLSFFLAGFLISCWVIQRLWNSLRRDFVFLPYLGYPRAVGLVSLWGLLFVLVLTMISGARELLTPGAWERSGVAYKLADPSADPDAARKEQLVLLKAALWSYAKAHDGRFPLSRTDPGIAPQRWLLPEATGQQYYYRPGVASPFDGVPLAWEPDVFDGERFVMLDGHVLTISNKVSREVLKALATPDGGEKIDDKDW